MNRRSFISTFPAIITSTMCLPAFPSIVPASQAPDDYWEYKQWVYDDKSGLMVNTGYTKVIKTIDTPPYLTRWNMDDRVVEMLVVDGDRHHSPLQLALIPS